MKTYAYMALALCLAGCAGSPRPLQFIGGEDLVYPPAAKAAALEGRVVVRYDVTAQGRVVNAVVDLAMPRGVFEEAALAMVRSWRFKPLVEGGNAVDALNRVSEVVFKLGDDARYDRLPAPRTPRAPDEE